jgi:hypothetical protein
MAGEQQGPFDRILNTPAPPGDAPRAPDRAAIYVGGTIIGLALLLLVLVLPPVSILSRGGGDGGVPSQPGVADSYTATTRSGVPRLPAGFVAASAMYDLAAPENGRGASLLTIPVKDAGSEARNLAFYTYVDGRWERIADVAITEAGAQGEVSTLPGNVIVLRRSRATLQVAGAMPAGATLHPEAESVITVLHPLVFIAGANGEVVGDPPAVPPAPYQVVPGILAPVPDAVDNVMRSSDLRSSHAQTIANVVTQGNFAGIDIDYRFVNPTLRDQFTAFVEELATALHADGRELTLTLPLPQRNGGEIDEGAFDWERLGALADTIELAGELNQELYFDETAAALDYITARADRSKLLLAIPSHSVESGSDGLRTMTLTEALTLASTIGVRTDQAITPGAQVPLVAQLLADSEGAGGLRWDDLSRSVTFSYPGRGGKRTVWIANRFSAAFRVELARRYSLGGVVLSDVSESADAADTWQPVRALAETGELTLTKPNSDLFTPAWSASGGAVQPSSGGAVTWTAPEASGPYDITLIVSDGVARAGQRVTLSVEAPAPAD